MLTVAEIQGIPARYWYGGLPDYATADDCQGMAELPTPGSANWDPAQPSASIPQWSLILRTDGRTGQGDGLSPGPVEWMRTNPLATDELAVAADAAVGSTATLYSVTPTLDNDEWYGVVTTSTDFGDPATGYGAPGSDANTGTVLVTVTRATGAGTVALAIFLGGVYSSSQDITAEAAAGTTIELSLASAWDLAIWNEGDASDFTIVVESSALPTWTGALTNTEAGRVAGSWLWTGTELVQVVTATGSARTFTVERAQWGTDAAVHPVGSDLYDSPPALIDRYVEVREVAVGAASSASESAIRRGYVQSEPAADLHAMTLAVRAALDWRLTQSAPYTDGRARSVDHPWLLERPDGVPTHLRAALPVIDTLTGEDVAIPAHTGGGYWYFPEPELLVAALTVNGMWGVERADLDQPISGSTADISSPPEDDELRAVQVVYSDADQPYCPFGYFASAVDTVSDHPAVIARNLIVSTQAGGNDDGQTVSYDRGDGAGSGLWQWSLKLPAARLDHAAWDEFQRRTPGVRAQRLYLGIPGERDTLADVLTGLVTPLGWAPVWLTDGRLSVVRLGDVYTAAAVALQHFVAPEQWRHETLSRPTDEVEYGVDPTPEGKARHKVHVRETELAALYPRRVGAKVELESIPYALDQWDRPEAPCVRHALSWMAQVTRRVPTVEVVIDQRHWGTVDIGRSVTTEDVHIRNPSTGLRWATGDDPLPGVALSSSPDARNRTTRSRLWLNGDGLRVATYGPSAALNGTPTVDGATLVCTTLEHYEPDVDGLADNERFAVGDLVLPIDKRSRVCVGATAREVVELGTNRIVLDGATALPASAVWLVSAYYDDAAAAQRTRHAFVADASSKLGAADEAPYQWGN